MTRCKDWQAMMYYWAATVSIHSTAATEPTPSMAARAAICCWAVPMMIFCWAKTATIAWTAAMEPTPWMAVSAATD